MDNNNDNDAKGRKPSRLASKELPDLAHQFSTFLHVTDDDAQVVRRHRHLLSRGAARFAEIFYDYLFAFPATASVLNEYRQAGGNVDGLVKSQLQHLLQFLEADTGAESSSKLIHVGQIHYQRRIEPI